MKTIEVRGYFVNISQNQDLVRCIIARDKDMIDVVDTFMLPNATINDENIVEKIKLYIDEVI